MKVLLREDVDNLGYAGEVLQVADGYGRNYLIPRGLAVKASPGALKQAHSWRERAAVRLDELRREHDALANRISDTNLNFVARAGETGKLYGSVTTGDMAERLNELLGTDVDRRLITSGPLRQLGEHRVTIRLSRDYQPQIVVHIHPHTESPETEEAETTEEDVSDVEAIAETEQSAVLEAESEETAVSTDQAGVTDDEGAEEKESEEVTAVSTDQTEVTDDESAEEKEIAEESAESPDQAEVVDDEGAEEKESEEETSPED